MPAFEPRFSREEFARRGEEIYARDLEERFGLGDAGKYIVIDIESGDYEVDVDELRASDRLMARRPNAQVWVRRVGSRFARRFGRDLGCRP